MLATKPPPIVPRAILNRFSVALLLTTVWLMAALGVIRTARATGRSAPTTPVASGICKVRQRKPMSARWESMVRLPNQDECNGKTNQPS